MSRKHYIFKYIITPISLNPLFTFIFALVLLFYYFIMDKVLFSSKSCEWSTPQDLFNQLDSEFYFTLDPCSAPFPFMIVIFDNKSMKNTRIMANAKRQTAF